MVCPGASGNFKRSQLTMFDKVGFDVSCNYKTASADITIYLTMRDPALLQRDFNAATQAVAARTPGAMPRTSTLAAPPGWEWLQAAFDERGGTVRSDVLYARLSGWEYEIRATFRPEDEAAVTAAITDISATVRRTAGPRLAACQAGGKRIDGTGPRNQNLAVLQALSVAAATIAKQTVTTLRPGMVWCPDIGFGLGTGAYVWWHNITPADDGPVDRITSIADGSTYFVVRVPADVGKAVAEKVGGAGSLGAGDTYAVVVDQSQSTQIAGIFNGRPSFKDVTGLVLERAFGVYAEIRKPDGGITVYKPF